jgi:GT2 family glycosyltransferase
LALPVSIVVCSRERPDLLLRCLNGIAQLDYDPFEVIVVACPAGIAALKRFSAKAQLKTVTFDQANLSMARNLGIAEAAGEIVAFIDDDAVPEPLWLRHLIAPFETEEGLAATGGYVIGRNGISFQWKGRSVDERGIATALDISDTQTTVLQPAEGRAIKTEGTNMAVRRDILAEMGGFDPAYRYFLDETDLNLRLARAGHATAIAPLAQVQHGFAESASRRRDRSPRDLFEIAASQSVFLRKFCPKSKQTAAWRDFRHQQKLRLLRFMQTGPLDPLDVLKLMRSLRAGRREGQRRPLSPLPPIARSATGFLAFEGRPEAPRQVLYGRRRDAKDLRAKADSAAQAGAIVTVFLLDRTARFHSSGFTGHHWEQAGGLFGRSTRDAALIQPWRLRRRVDAELKRVEPVRGTCV